MFLARISCKHIVFVLNVCFIPIPSQKVQPFSNFFPFQFPLCPFKFTISILFCTCMEQIVYFFSGLECVGYFFCLCRPFCTFERCLDSNPESKKAGALPTYCIFIIHIGQRTSKSHRCSAATLSWVPPAEIRTGDLSCGRQMLTTT
jgi:hypothetical protein